MVSLYSYRTYLSASLKLFYRIRRMTPSSHLIRPHLILCAIPSKSPFFCTKDSYHLKLSNCPTMYLFIVITLLVILATWSSFPNSYSIYSVQLLLILNLFPLRAFFYSSSLWLTSVDYFLTKRCHQRTK